MSDAPYVLVKVEIINRHIGDASSGDFAVQVPANDKDIFVPILVLTE